MDTNTETRPQLEKLHAGDTIRTFKGLYVDVFNPDPKTLDIEDIAHALSQVCRFAGHTHKFYSVAQHCIECVTELTKRGTEDKKILLTMLMHDATEAYLGDMARPIKKRMPEYKNIENLLMATIAEKWELYFPFPPVIKTIDNYILEVEHDSVILRKNYIPIREPREAEEQFLYLFKRLRDPLS